MSRPRLGSIVWLGPILVGLGLGAYVFAAWPEPAFQLIRLPYGESMPKTPLVAVERQAPVVVRVVASAGTVTQSRAQIAAERTAQRELAGPPPVASESERDGYRPETPEELGAKSLPGMYPAAPAVAVTR